MEPNVRAKLDWKFYAMFIAALGGVVVPVWLWRADHQARSLQLRLTSQTSLEPDVPKTISGLKLSLDGAAIDQPFLSVLELANDGDRPISATDYEDSIQILMSEGVRLIRAQVIDVQPKDLQPKFSGNGGNLLISPLLLNPGDTITFAVITARGKPSFKVRTRIAGIQSVSVVSDDRATRRSSATSLALRSLMAFLLLFVYASCALVLIAKWRFELPRIVLVIGAFASIAGISELLLPAGGGLMLSTTQMTVFFAALGAIATVLAVRMNRR